jgi:hypothetical protein
MQNFKTITVEAKHVQDIHWHLFCKLNASEKNSSWSLGSRFLEEKKIIFVLFAEKILQDYLRKIEQKSFIQLY